MKKRLSILILSFMLIFSFTACNSKTTTNENNKPVTQNSTNSETRQVTDQAGTVVNLPKNIERIGDLWHANNQIVLLLGGADKLVATTDMVKKLAWFNKVYPNIKNLSTPLKGNDVQLEELMKAKPDVVLSSNDKQIEAMRNAGLPAVKVFFQNFSDLKKTVKITGQVIGPDAEKIADEYIKELDSNIKYVQDRLKDIPSDKKLSVLHINDGKNLTKIDGQKSMIGEWMNIAGAVNSIPEAKNLATVTMEEIIASDPDVIIVGGDDSKQGIETLKSDPKWADVKAVKNNKLYRNPVGTFLWDRYSAEEALQVLWAAKTFYPDKFTDLNMLTKVQEFYKKYYNYTLSDKDAKLILSGDNPSN